jgi:hypothetical protein
MRKKALFSLCPWKQHAVGKNYLIREVNYCGHFPGSLVCFSGGKLETFSNII